MMKSAAGRPGQVPGPSDHVWPTIDDRYRDHPAGETELDPRATRQRPMSDTHELGRVGQATGRPLTVEAWAVEAGVGVVAPWIPGHRAGSRLGLGAANRTRRLRVGRWFQKGGVRLQDTVRSKPRIRGRYRRHRPAHKGHGLDRNEELRFEGQVGVSTRSDHAGDGDHGERGDERHTRDDLCGSHVAADRSRIRRWTPMTGLDERIKPT